jgi:hypothetical protein
MSAMEETGTSPARAIRLVPVPRPAPRRRIAVEPPMRGQGTLALQLAPAAPPAPAPPPSTWLEDDEEPPAPTDPAGLPDPRGWSAMIAQALVEVLAGRRPPVQLLRWVDPEIYDRIRRSAPQRAPRQAGAPVRVRRVRVSTAPDGNVEAVAIVDDGVRCRALALRLDALERRWVCTALEMV